MTHAFFLYTDLEGKQLDRNKLLNLLCCSSTNQVLIVDTLKDLKIILVYSKGQSEDDILYFDDDKLVFYTGNCFINDMQQCINGTPFAKAGYFITNKVSDARGAFCKVVVRHKANKVINVEIQTDDLGFEPLYYRQYNKDNGLIASNYAEALSLFDNNINLDYEAVASFFATGILVSDETFLKDITRVKPNEVINYDAHTRKIFRQKKNRYRLFDLSPSKSISDHYEKLYWNVREAVRSRIFNALEPIELRLSGGLDSRLLLHCLMEEKADFHATNFWYNTIEEEDSSIPFELSKKLGFSFMRTMSEEWSPSNNVKELIGGQGKCSEFITRLKMSGSFAAFPMKKEQHFDFMPDRLIESDWKKINLIASYDPIELYNQLEEKLSSFYLSENLRGKEIALFYNHYSSFIFDFDEPRFSRPANYFRGTRLLPFCDEELFLTSAMDLNINGIYKEEYLKALQRKMPALLKIKYHSSGSDSSTSKVKKKSSQFKTQQIKNKIELLSRNDHLMDEIFKNLLDDQSISSPTLLNRLMIFGMWSGWVR